MTNKLEISKTPNYTLTIRGPARVILKLRKYFTVTERKKFLMGNPKDRNFGTSERDFPLYDDSEEDERTIIIPAGLIDYLSYYLPILRRKGFDFEVEILHKPLDPIVISEKWRRVLYDFQLGICEKLIGFSGGIADVYTGAGKTEMLLSIADSFPDKVVVLVPSNSIKKEIVTRAKKYEVSVGTNINNNERITVLNPVGFCRSKDYDNSGDFFQDVKLVITDECHHLSANSIKKFFALMPNVDRSYGFSASPDSNEGRRFTVARKMMKDYTLAQAMVLGFSGTVKCFKKPRIDVSLVRVSSGITREGGANPEEADWMECLSRFLKEDRLSRVIKKIVDRHPETKFYIPVHKIDSGIILQSNLSRVGIKCLFWSAGKIIPEDLKTDQGDLLSVKRAITELDYTVLISTTVGYEGIDIPSLGGLIPLTGTNFRMTVQPIGRSSRSRKVLIVLIYDFNNPLILSQSKKRREIIQAHYNVIKDERITL